MIGEDIKRDMGISNWLEPALVTVLPAILYLNTLAPTITWANHGQDGGDLITAVYTSGVPHPPGYPTYVLLGKLFSWLPAGDVAYRLNLMSAVCAALAVALVYLVARDRLIGSGSPAWMARVSALGAAWALAVSPLFWSQAIVAEVYTLNAFFIALCLLLLVRWQVSGGGLGWLVGLFLAFGLALGNHLTIALLIAPTLIYLAFHKVDVPVRRFRACWLPALALAAGLSVYWYLPWAAWRDPPVNWGDPRTLARFVWVVSGGPYRAYVFALPLAQVPARLSALAHLLVEQFGLWGVALGLTGLARLWREDRAFGLLTAASAALYATYAVGYDTSDSYVCLIPAFLLFAVWAGIGAWTILAALRDRWARLAGAAWLGVIVAVACINWGALDLSHDRSAYAWGLTTLEGAPRDEMIITARDRETFSLWYLQHVAGIRPDVVIVDKDLLGYDWYRQSLRVHYPRLILEGESVSSLVTDNLDRPALRLSDVAAVAP